MPGIQTISKDGLSQDVLDYIEGLEGENNTLAEALDEATDALAKAAETDPDTNDDPKAEVLKGLPEDIAEIVKGIVAPLQAENEQLRSEVAGEKDIRLTAEQIAKAASFGFGDTAELGEVLKHVNAECGADVYEKLVKNLDAAKNQIEESKLFSEHGSTGEGMPTEGIAKAASLNEAAAELVSKGTSKSMSDALRHLANTRPELFKEGD